MSTLPEELRLLIQNFKLLPGVGSKTAERFAFQLLKWPDEQIQRFALLLTTLKEKVGHCSVCGCLSSEQECPFCTSPERDPSLLCIVGTAREVYAIENTSYRGLYHVLGTLLSPLDGRSIDQLKLQPLFDTLNVRPIKEVIIALDSTLEGDATALYIKEKIQQKGIPVSRLAFGLPMGSPLEYVDEGTLARAFAGRRSFS